MGINGLGQEESRLFGEHMPGRPIVPQKSRTYEVLKEMPPWPTKTYIQPRDVLGFAAAILRFSFGCRHGVVVHGVFWRRSAALTCLPVFWPISSRFSTF